MSATVKRDTGRLALVIVACALACAPFCARPQEFQPERAGFWPHFLGPNSDKISPETGLLRRWPDGGPRLIWRYDECGNGQSSVTVAEGLIFSAGDFDDECVVYALDMNGRLKWRSANGKAWKGALPGSRATPTWSDGMVYHLNAHGLLSAYLAATGEPVWSVDFYQKYNLQRYSQFGYAESPTVVNDKVIVMPGGKEGFVVAFDRKTGRVAWECPVGNMLFDKVSYCTPSVATMNGVRQVLYLSYFRVLGVDARTGRMLWSQPHFPGAKHLTVLTVNPVYHDGMVFITTPYDNGAKCFRFTPSGDGLEEAWVETRLNNEHGGVVLIDGYLYGCGGYDYPLKGWVASEVTQGVLYCVEMKTGKVMWEKNIGRCSITAAEGMLYCRHELGSVFLIEARPDRASIVSQFNLPVRIRTPSLNHPVVAGGRLYLRSLNSLFVYDIRR